ncbi:MAG: post-transcriptional regulator [Bacilli bacterium]|nr:post-transcriptional regulator [Bacilli bacterium]
MSTQQFNIESQEDLYSKLEPALTAKVNELKRNNIKYIAKHNIWRYLKKYYWLDSKDLTLGEMVNDILSTPNSDLENYMVDIIKNRVEKEKNSQDDYLL